MLRGRIAKDRGKLFLSGQLYLPNLGVDGPVDFQVDTGADTTLISLDDLEALGADLAAVEGLPVVQVRGLGGRIELHEAPAVLSFDDGVHEYHYEVTITVPRPGRAPRIPSVLGRDILERWRMVYDRKADTLTFEVHEADLQVP